MYCIHAFAHLICRTTARFGPVVNQGFRGLLRVHPPDCGRGTAPFHLSHSKVESSCCILVSATLMNWAIHFRSLRVDLP